MANYKTNTSVPKEFAVGIKKFSNSETGYKTNKAIKAICGAHDYINASMESPTEFAKRKQWFIENMNEFPADHVAEWKRNLAAGNLHFDDATKALLKFFNVDYNSIIGDASLNATITNK